MVGGGGWWWWWCNGILAMNHELEKKSQNLSKFYQKLIEKENRFHLIKLKENVLCIVIKPFKLIPLGRVGLSNGMK